MLSEKLTSISTDTFRRTHVKKLSGNEVEGLVNVSRVQVNLYGGLSEQSTVEDL